MNSGLGGRRVDHSHAQSSEVTVQVDGRAFRLPRKTTGAGLRLAAGLESGEDRDLYLERAGLAEDESVADGDQLDLDDGMVFFSTPRTILQG